MLARQRKFALTHFEHRLIKDSWQPWSACLLGKPPHLPYLVQVIHSDCGAFMDLARRGHCPGCSGGY